MTQISYFSLHSPPLILAFFNGSYLQQLLVWCLPKGDSISRTLLSHLLGRILLQGRAIPSPHLFIDPIIYISTDSWVFILFRGLNLLFTLL